MRQTALPSGHLLHQQYRNVAVRNDALGNAAHQGPAQQAVAVRAHDQHLSALALGGAHNLICR